MAKTATGKPCFSPLFFLSPHFGLETVTKAATKNANAKTANTKTKAGEFDVYMRVLHSLPTAFSPTCIQLLLTTRLIVVIQILRQAQARALRLSDLLQREYEEMERGESRSC